MEWCESDELHGTLLALAHSCCSCQTHATHAPPRQQPSVASAATATLAWGRPRGRRRPASSCKGAAQVQRRRLHVPTSPTQDAACNLTSMPPDTSRRLACYASRTPIRRRPRQRPQAQQQPTSITAPADWHQRVGHLAPYQPGRSGDCPEPRRDHWVCGPSFIGRSGSTLMCCRQRGRGGQRAGSEGAVGGGSAVVGGARTAGGIDTAGSAVGGAAVGTACTVADESAAARRLPGGQSSSRSVCDQCEAV